MEIFWNLKKIVTFYGIKGLERFQFSRHRIQMILAKKWIKYSYSHHPAQETGFHTFPTYTVSGQKVKQGT